MMGAWDRLKKMFSDKTSRNIFLYTFICGLMAHGFVFFNKLAWHDELQHGFRLSASRVMALGRWLRAGLGWIVAKLFGDYNLSLPWVHGLISVFFISLSVLLIIRLFHIKEKAYQILVAGLLVSFPVVASTFGYMFTAPYYFIALFLSVWAVYLTYRMKNVWGLILGAGLICSSMAIYQPYVGVAVSLFVILLIIDIAKNRYDGVAGIFKHGFYYLGTCLGGVVGYMVMWKVTMAIFGIKAGDYQGISSMGEGGIGKYFDGVARAYKSFLMQFENPIEDVYPMSLSVVQWIIIIGSLLLGLYLAGRQFKKHKGQAVLMLLLIAILPLALNVVYVMASSSAESKVHSLMLYGMAMLYVFFICALREVTKRKTDVVFDPKSAEEVKIPEAAEASEDTKDSEEAEAPENEKRKFRPAGLIAGLATAVLFVAMFMMIYISNAAYLRADMQQQQAISDLTVLTAKIKTLDGYTDNMKVCFVMEGKRDKTRTTNKEFANITFMPYTNVYPYHNQRNVANFLEHWCGFAPTYVSQKQFKDREEVKAMPSYPDDGSIKIIDDTVVIKW